MRLSLISLTVLEALRSASTTRLTTPLNPRPPHRTDSPPSRALTRNPFVRHAHSALPVLQLHQEPEAGLVPQDGGRPRGEDSEPERALAPGGEVRPGAPERLAKAGRRSSGLARGWSAEGGEESE